jgi:WD40 repeat protein
MSGTASRVDYAAFISYSHAADGELGRALERSLEAFAKPWYARRRLRVFRDQTTLALTPELWPTIEAALRGSGFLVLLASPQAAASRWVAQEVDVWLREHGAHTILIVLTGGELAWDAARGCFDEARTTALPPALRTAFAHEPLWADLRWAYAAEQISERDARYRDAVATLAAALHGVPKDALVGEDIRQHRRQMRLAWSAAIALAVLAIGATAAGLVAIGQRNVARERERVAFARQLSLQAAALAREEPNEIERSALLAIESLRESWSADAQRTLREALALLPDVTGAFGQNPFLYEVELSPDDSRIAVATEEGAILWTRESGDYLDLHAGAKVRDLDFDSTGEALVTAGDDGFARLWNARTGDAIDAIEHAAPVVAVDMSPDDRLLATGTDGDDATARLFDLETGDILLEWPGGDDEVREVSFSSGGRYLGAISTDGPHAVFDRDDGWQQVELERGPLASSLDLAFDADETRLAITRGNEAVVWSLPDGEILRRVVHSDFARDANMDFDTWINRVAVSPDGGLLGTAGRDATARIWDIGTGEELARLPHAGPVESILFTPDGRRVATASVAGARLWELPSGAEVTRVPLLSGIGHGLDVSRDGDWLVSEGPDLAIVTWRAGRKDRVATFPHPDDVRLVTCGPDGRTIATIDDAYDVRVLSTDGTSRPGAANLFNPRRMRFSPDGRFLDVHAQVGLHRIDIDTGMQATEIVRNLDEIAFGGARAATILPGGAWVIWNLESGESRPGPGDTRGHEPIAMTRDGRYLAATYGGQLAGEDGFETVRVWDLDDESLVWERTHDQRFFDLAISEGGRTLVAHTDREAVLLTAGGGVTDLPLAGALETVVFTADGRIAVGAVGPDVYVWSTTVDGQPTILSHNADVSSMQASPDGGHLATAAGSVISVWDLASGELVSQWNNRSRVSQACFLDDGKYVVTGDAGNDAIVWRWQRSDLVDQACSTLGRNFTRGEWTRYFGDRPYRRTCEQLPGADDPVER